jgi:hypothetical protein
MVLAAAAGCGAPPRRWPFPEVAPAGDGEVLAILRSRTEGVESAYAELSMSFEGLERSAVATAVVRYEAPGKIRMTAFKDLLVSARGIFDLLLAPGGFVIEVEGESGPERRSGGAGDLSALPRGFRALAALREAMFLPGRIPAGAPAAVERDGGRVVVRAAVSSGHEVEWTLEPRTLGIESARLRLVGAPEPITVEYSSYRLAGGVYIPEAFTLRDPGEGVVVEGLLEDIELNPALEPAAFDPASVGRPGSP